MPYADHHYNPADIEPANRKGAIVAEYLVLLDKHMDELRAGTAENTLEIGDFADALHIHPRHLSNTIHEVLGESPCSLYEARLLAIAQELLLTTPHSVAHIARQMSYDPSNFSKFFKSYTGETPKQFREARRAKDSELLTMFAE